MRMVVVGTALVETRPQFNLNLVIDPFFRDIRKLDEIADTVVDTEDDEAVERLFFTKDAALMNGGRVRRGGISHRMHQRGGKSVLHKRLYDRIAGYSGDRYA